MDAFELLGYWWLPEDRGVRWTAGRVSFEPQSGITVQLHGSLSGSPVVGMGDDARIPVLQGMTEDGKEWTLLDLNQTGATNRFPGYPIASYRAQVGLRNVRYGTDTPTFSRVWIQTSRLSDWVGQGVWQRTVQFDEDEEDQRKRVHYRVENVTPQDIEVRLEALRATLRITYGFSTRGGGAEDVVLGESVALAVETEDALSIEQVYRSIVFPLQNFMSLATNHVNVVTSLAVADPNVTVPREGDDRLLSIDVFLALTGEDTRDSRLLPPWMLFTLARVENRLEALLNAWFDVSTRLEVVCQLLFGQEYAGEFLLDLAFLAYAQAAEAYHRLAFGGTPYSDEEYAELTQAILSTAPEQYCDWLEGLLRHANFITYRNRLGSVFDHVAPVGDQLGGRDRFISAIVAERNDLTHRNDSGSGETSVERLFLLTQALKIMLRACLLRDVGFSAEECGELFAENEQFRQWAERIRPVLS